MLNRIILFFIISFSPLYSYADFEIRQPCTSDADVENKKGVKLKFYASLLAYNSEKPRCILIEPIIASYQVEEAATHNDPVSNDIIIDILLTREGKEQIAKFTGENIGKPMALIVDEKILVMPVIESPIVEGKIQIRGLWYEDAIRLRKSINQK